MATYHRVYDSRHLQADCQEPGSAPEPYARQSSMGYLYLFHNSDIRLEFAGVSVLRTALRRGVIECCGTVKSLTASDSCSTAVTRAFDSAITSLSVHSLNSGYAEICFFSKRNCQSDYVNRQCTPNHFNSRLPQGSFGLSLCLSDY